MMIPLFEKDGFILTVERLQEDISIYDHFVTECGWSEKDIENMTDENFFCVKVTAWRTGKMYAESYLGCCYYESLREFIDTAGYIDDMINDVLIEAKQAAKAVM